MPDRRKHRGPHPEDRQLFAAAALPGLHSAVEELSWLLEQPVSNSGRIKTILGQLSKQHGWAWTVERVDDPDAALIRSCRLVASADSQILDRADCWVNLARAVIDAERAEVWIIERKHR